MVQSDFFKALWSIASKEAGPGAEPICPARPGVCKELGPVCSDKSRDPRVWLLFPCTTMLLVWTTWVYKTTGLFKHFHPMK